MRLSPLLVILGAMAWAALLVSAAPAARAAIPMVSGGATQSPAPPPSAVPVHAFLLLDVSSGGPNTAITVNGGQFNPNQQLTLYWDLPDHVAGSATADANGSFSTRVKPFDGDQPGIHHLCASVLPRPCATFTLEAAAGPSPTPSPSPSASPEATPSASASPVPLTTRPNSPNGLDVVTRPPFVFLPLIGVAALLVSLGYWVLSIMRRPKTVNFPSAAVVHRATRPDYAAEFGTPPPTPASAPAPSAWADVIPKAPVPPPPLPEPEPPLVAEGPPPNEWPELPAPTAEEIREEMRQFLQTPDEPGR